MASEGQGSVSQAPALTSLPREENAPKLREQEPEEAAAPEQESEPPPLSPPDSPGPSPPGRQDTGSKSEDESAS